MECKCCKRENSIGNLRFGVCFDCANAESIITEGVDMYDKEIPQAEGLSKSLSKVQYIIKLYNSEQFKKK